MKDKVLTDRYLQEGETEDDMYRRVAKAIANGDSDLEPQFYCMMRDGLFLPNTPTLVNAGTDNGGLSACYVVPIEDSLDSIYHALVAQGHIHKSFGGTGFDFSKLRPKGTEIASTGGTATGPIGFMKLFNCNADAVRQGGKREGANMGILRVDHPDIEEFICCKEKEGELSHFNISVAVTDIFMKAACVAGDQFELTSPINPDTYETCVNARELLNNICEHIWKNGEPGIVFIDEVNKHNQTPNLGDITATNPCVVGDTLIQTVEGEIPIRDLVGKTIDVYCIDPDTYELKIATATNIKCTQKNAELVKVNTTRRSVICTPDHMFYTKTYGWKEAKDLYSHHNIVGLNKFPRNRRHTMIMLSGSNRSTAIAEHRFIAGYYANIEDLDVHHINGNHNDNRLSNLEVLKHGEHSRLTNIGHEGYCDKSPDDGRFIKSDSPKCEAPSNALGINPVYKNFRFINTEHLDYTEDVYDMNVSEYHNFFANGICVHNCGEQPLLPWESCNLGSINLAKFVGISNDSLHTGIPIILWDTLSDTVKLAVQFLNNVIDVNNYPLKEIEEASKLTRKIGLGVMGWHDMLVKMGLPYNSDEALQLADQVMMYINDIACDVSNRLAKEDHSFPSWMNSIWDDKHIGMANATLTTIAPTGSLSIIAECSSGVEPVFAWKHIRKIESGEFEVKHPTYDEAVAWNDKAMMDVASDIPWQAHVAMQAAFQKHVHNAVSKTINLPNDATVEDIKDAIMLAWKLKCKGITMYRDGSRNEQVLSRVSEPESSIEQPSHRIKHTRPKVLTGTTEKLVSGCGEMFVTVNMLDGAPYEVIIPRGSGGCQANMEAIGRLISLGLRSDISIDDITKQLNKVQCSNAIRSSKSEGDSCAQIIGGQLTKYLRPTVLVADGDMVTGDMVTIDSETNLVHRSTDNPTGIVSKLVPDQDDRVTSSFTVDDIPHNAQCPECGAVLSFGEGCMNGSCPNCGWSGCS